MTGSRRTVKRSAKPGTVERSRIRAAAKQIKREREASSGRYVVKR